MPNATLKPFEPPQSSAPAATGRLGGSLLKRLPWAVFWALAGQGVISVSRFLTTMTVGGRFKPENAAEGALFGSAQQLGYYATAFSALMVAVAVHEAFVTTPLSVFIHGEQPQRRRKFSGTMLWASLGIATMVLAVALIFFCIKGMLPGQYETLYHVLFFVGLLAPLQLLREFSRRWLLANFEVFPSAVFEFAYVGLYLSMLFGLVWMAQVTALSAFFAIAIANGVVLVAWWLRCGNGFESKADGRTQDLKRNFSYGKWVAGENICSILTIYLCNWLLLFRINEEAAGVFFACFSIMLLANPFLLGISSLLFPRAAQEFNDNGWLGLKRILIQYSTLVLIVMTSVATLLWAKGDWLTDLFFDYSAFFDANYDGRNRVTATLGLCLPFMGMSFVLTAGLLAVHKPIYSFWSALVGLLALIGVFTLSTSQPDLITAAWSIVFAMAANMLCRLAFIVKASVEHDPNEIAEPSIEASA